MTKGTLKELENTMTRISKVDNWVADFKNTFKELGQGDSFESNLVVDGFMKEGVAVELYQGIASNLYHKYCELRSLLSDLYKLIHEYEQKHKCVGIKINDPDQDRKAFIEYAKYVIQKTLLEEYSSSENEDYEDYE
jgi:hypothetical protein